MDFYARRETAIKKLEKTILDLEKGSTISINSLVYEVTFNYGLTEKTTISFLRLLEEKKIILLDFDKDKLTRV